jgi:hypothetical protein
MRYQRLARDKLETSRRSRELVGIKIPLQRQNSRENINSKIQLVFFKIHYVDRSAYYLAIPLVWFKQIRNPLPRQLIFFLRGSLNRIPKDFFILYCIYDLLYYLN